MSAPQHPVWLWVPRLFVVAVMVFVSYLKLTGNAADIALFTELGMEPYGRVAIGLIEGACALLMLSHYAAVGGVLTSAVMTGAVIAHVTKLGIIVDGDGGKHVMLLAAVMLCSLAVAYVRRRELPLVGDTL
jgi:putative oxidoreductase